MNKAIGARARHRTLLPAAILSLGALWSACIENTQHEGDAPSISTTMPVTAEGDAREVDPVVEGVIAADWPGFALGVPAPEVRAMGAAELASSDEGQANPPPAASADDPTPFIHLPETELDLVDFKTGNRYRVSIPDEVDAVVSERARQVSENAPGEKELGDGAIPKRIQGTDSRVPLGVADGQPQDGWLAAIGLLNPDACTGTLISRTAYVTAAHCIYTASGKVVKRDFMPRADTNFDFPWGVWVATSASAPAAWAQNKCYEKTKPECTQYDLALVKVTPDASYPGHKWVFATAAESRPTLLTRQLKNRGYASCEATDAPPGCIDGMLLFGDRANCTLGADVYPDDPYSPVIYHGCDTNEGHSGSPMFYYRSTGSPVMIGVHVGSTQIAGVWKNEFKRFSSNTLRWFNGLL